MEWFPHPLLTYKRCLITFIWYHGLAYGTIIRLLAPHALAHLFKASTVTVLTPLCSGWLSWYFVNLFKIRADTSLWRTLSLPEVTVVRSLVAPSCKFILSYFWGHPQLCWRGFHLKMECSAKATTTWVMLRTVSLSHGSMSSRPSASPRTFWGQSWGTTTWAPTILSLPMMTLCRRCKRRRYCMPLQQALLGHTEGGMPQVGMQGHSHNYYHCHMPWYIGGKMSR